MGEAFDKVGGAILSDGGLSAFILFVALVASNLYHIQTARKNQADNREDIAAAWQCVNSISEATNKSLSDMHTALVLIRDRLERH